MNISFNLSHIKIRQVVLPVFLLSMSINLANAKNAHNQEKVVYDFAAHTLQQILSCQQDCGTEFLQQLRANEPVLTKACSDHLRQHFMNNQDIYQKRIRKLILNDTGFYSHKVQQKNASTWQVTDAFEVHESVLGIPARGLWQRYRMRIIQTTPSVFQNPNLLLFDCFEI